MKILAFGAHPDDIEVSVGGTILKYRQRGDQVIGIIVTVPFNKEIRIEEAKKAAAILDMDLKILDLNPNEVIFTRKLVGTFDNIIGKYAPDIIYTHWINDTHQDHRNVALTTIAAARYNKSSLYMYEQTIPGGIGISSFKAQLYIDISDVIDKKMESILAHRSQVYKNKEWWLSGLKGRCAHHGYQIGVKYAEVFEVIKEINKL